MIFNNSGVYQSHIGFPSRAGGYLGPDAATVGPEYLLLRPETAGGDLVLPHAVGVHGLVLLAVPAVLAARTALDRRRQLAVVGTASASVGVALAILLVHALRQLPLATLGPPRNPWCAAKRTYCAVGTTLFATTPPFRQPIRSASTTPGTPPRCSKHSASSASVVSARSLSAKRTNRTRHQAGCCRPRRRR